MSNVTLTIDDRKVLVPAESKILDAARAVGIDIPTLCYHPDLEVRASCRICVVEVERARTLVAACATPVAEGMVVRTNTPVVRQARRTNLGLILSSHPQDCLSCVRSESCELQHLAHRLQVGPADFPLRRPLTAIDDASASIVRDANKCILCGRCVAVCADVQGIGAIGTYERGFDTVIAPANGLSLADVPCVYCGQCVNRCPVGALYEKDHTEDVWAALADPGKVVVAQVAPAVRVSIGEELGLGLGRNLAAPLAAAMRQLGFDRIFDTDFSADLTIMEEGNELIKRLGNDGALPMFTSCCPGWVRYAESFFPELLPHLSTCKSPQQMMGALIKTYYAEKAGLHPSDIVTVSVMPCTAKKYECAREEMAASGHRDVDYVLTTRELGAMLRESGIDLSALPGEPFDDPLGEASGAGVLFGATGGVMEAALRTAHAVLTGHELPRLEMEPVRGLEGCRQAEVRVGGRTLKVAVVHGLANSRALIEALAAGKAEADFVEVMACPGGCIGGGGQPRPACEETRRLRVAAIHQADSAMTVRCSHLNPAVQRLYREFLGEPLGPRSHRLLHTHYRARRFGIHGEESAEGVARGVA